MLKKCLIWLVPLLLFLGARAAPTFFVQAHTASEGRYVGELRFVEEPTPFTVSLTLSRTSKDGQFLVSGQAVKPDTKPIEIRGTYYVAKNRLAAFGERRGAEQLLSLTLDGYAGENSLVVKCKAKVIESNLNYEGEMRLDKQAGGAQDTSITMAIRPDRLVVGQPATGKLVISVRNFGAPGGISVSGFVQSVSVDGQKKTMGSSSANYTVQADGDIEVDLAKLGITPREATGNDALGIEVLFGTKYAIETTRVDIARPTSGSLDVVGMQVISNPREIVAGGTIAFSLNYRLQNSRSADTEFTITERIKIQHGNDAPEDGGSVTWSGKVASLQVAGKTAESKPIEVRFPGVGEYRVEYEISGPGVNPYKGSLTIQVGRPSTGGGTTTGGGGGFVEIGSIQGSVQLSKSSIKVGDSVDLVVSYQLSGRSEADVDEVIELVGPNGSVVSSSNKRKSISIGEANVRRFLIDAFDPGTYSVKARVKGDAVSSFEAEGSFKVEAKAGGTTGSTTGGAPPAQGTYGLVKKEIGQAASPGVGPYGTHTGTITESSVSLTWTATRDYEGTFNFQSKLSVPPAVLKPGEIVELTNESTANSSHKNQPYNGAGTRWYVQGAEVLESTNAFAGWASNGMFYASSSGKTRFKVGTGGTIVISSGVGSMVWGNDGKWNPCIYTYQWNAPPTVAPGDGGGAPPSGSTAMYDLDPEADEETGQISAYLEPKSLTLKAGEISQIVHIHINGFRTRTEDRVEVVFPEKTDNWASLPGQIVVNGGDGSYAPANMARPEHVDGYFFSARSTAPSGKQTVTIIVRQKKAGEVRLTLDVTVVGKSGSSGGGIRGGPWAGDWETNFGAMTLKQDRDMVSGKFGDADVYEIAGKVDELTFTFKVFDGTNEIGSGSFVLAADGQTFAGTWTYFGEAEKHEWKGKRKGTNNKSSPH